MINNVVLVGRLTKDVDVRYTGSGIAVGNFTLAVERNFKNAQGERETDFINCVIWRERAEVLASFASKGSLIAVEGSIETGSYEKDGRTVYTTNVNAQNFQMLESKEINEQRKRQSGGNPASNSPAGNQKPAGGYTKPATKNENPFANANFENENPFEGNDDVTDIADDDLPF